MSEFIQSILKKKCKRCGKIDWIKLIDGSGVTCRFCGYIRTKDYQTPEVYIKKNLKKKDRPEGKKSTLDEWF
jgi:ribosomal protein L37E